MIEVNITGENTFADDHLDQYDYGQSLRMCGDIPSPVEVQFSLQRSGGEAPRNLGVEVDGAVEVSIPDEMLRNNGATHDYNIYAFIYIRDETSGETTHRIIIPVKSRPKPGEYIPKGQPDFPEQLIQSVMQERQKAEDAAEKAEKASSEVSEEAKRTIDEYVEEKKESLKGEPGEPGTNGKSAYEYAVAGGYEGTEEEFRKMLATDVPQISELKGDIVNKLDRPATAQVGQIFRVKSINEDGTYVVEAVDMPSGGAITEKDVADWGFTKNTGTYTKPTGGIPASDLATGVIPEAIKNPNALTFTGAVTGCYDGSEPVKLEIPSGGGGNVTRKYQLIATLKGDGEATEVNANVELPDGEYIIQIKRYVTSASGTNSCFFKLGGSGIWGKGFRGFGFDSYSHPTFNDAHASAYIVVIDSIVYLLGVTGYIFPIAPFNAGFDEKIIDNIISLYSQENKSLPAELTMEVYYRG